MRKHMAFVTYRKKTYETAGTGVPMVHRDNEESCEDMQAEKLENIVKQPSATAG